MDDCFKSNSGRKKGKETHPMASFHKVNKVFISIIAFVLLFYCNYDIVIALLLQLLHFYSIRDCNNGNCHTCGGIILDNLTILTAAHCFKKGQNLSKISIMAGHKKRKAKKNKQVGDLKEQFSLIFPGFF